MKPFLLRDSIALVAIGIAALAWLPFQSFRGPDSLPSLLFILSWLGGPIAIGTGLLSLVRRPVLGAFLGLLVQLVVTVVFVLGNC